MEFLRNREVAKLTIVIVLLIAILSGIGFIYGLPDGILILCSCLSIAAVFFVYTKKRYNKLKDLAETIDVILHGNEIMAPESNREGELAILESEIYKMTIKLREHASAMQKEKIYLTDSIADISHQLRTPLTTVHLLIAAMQKEDIDFMQRQKLRDIKQLLARVEWLISSLLKISKIDAGTAGFQKAKVNVKELIDRAVEPLLVSMEIRDQSFEYSGEGGESYIGDVNWSVEALGNILKNCMEHTPAQGKIKVRCGENALYTEIIVKDDGSGINHEDLPHIFERFYCGRTSSESGVGIGLALARMIIIEQNGSIKVENDRREGGAVFTIRFYKLNA